jgi:glycosyltransferase involved in cell wall biosynthesis
MSRMSGRPAVLLVGNFFVSQLGGRGVCEDLALRLGARGWDVLTTSWHRSRPLRLLDMVTSCWRLRHRFDVAHVDVFSGGGFLWAEAACCALRAAGKPYLLTLRGGNLPGFAARWPGRVTRLLRSASRVLVPSAYLREAMLPYCPDLVLQPNPLDLAAYPFRTRERPEPRLMWVRAFHRIYNPALAVGVLARVLDRHPDAHLTMVGPDKGDGTLEATKHAAATAGVAGRVTFVGQVGKADVPGWMTRGGIFLNTADVDNAPVTVLEAMACGLPVVSTNVGGLPYLVQDGKDALLVAPGDPSAMAAAVLRLLDDPVLAGAISREARRTAAACDWADLLPRWEELLGSAAAPGPATRSAAAVSERHEERHAG